MGIFNKTKELEEDNIKETVDLNKDKPVKVKKVEDGDTKSMKDLYSNDNVGGKKKGSVSLAYRILVKPLITEKASDMSSLNQYSFVVSDSANKIDIAKAIFEVYGVKPISVNVVKVRGKLVSKGKIKGKRKDFKKAFVTLKKGETISIYEGV